MAKDFLYPLRCLHGQMYERKKEKEKLKDICQRIEQIPKQTALFVMTPTHGNLGDHAIAKASCSVLKRFQIPFVEITTQELALLKKYKRLNIMNHKFIIVNGGGNLGTLWFSVELLFRAIIKCNPSSQIVCLPNTIFYDDTEQGKKEFEESKRIYNAHHQMRIYARERLSYELMKTAYRDVVLMPDMVLAMNESQRGINEQRHGCILCLRNDVEKTRTQEEERSIYNQAANIFGSDIVISDMVVDHNIPLNKRNKELDSKFDEFRHTKLVITDRLHGMVFAAITGTPCIVINSKSPKVRGCYEWIKQLEYVKFADSVKNIEKVYKEIPDQEFVFDNSNLQEYYADLGKYLLSVIRKG